VQTPWKFVVVFAVTLLCGTGLMLWLLRQVPTRAVELHLVRAKSQSGSATFAISNCTKRSIGVLRVPLQCLRNGEWPKSLEHDRVYIGSIAAHQASTFVVTVPASDESWRLPIVWGFEPTRLDFWTAVLRENSQAVLSGRALPGFGVNIVMHTNFSEVQQPSRMKHESRNSDG
jgi:hypothetical protein